MKHKIQIILLAMMTTIGVMVQASESLPTNAMLIETILPGHGWSDKSFIYKVSVVSEGDNAIGAYSKANMDMLNIECKRVIYSWHVNKVSDEVMSEAISVYCEPRPVGEKFIMSVERTCEQNPTADCVKLIPQFNQVAPTTSIQIGRPQ